MKTFTKICEKVRKFISIICCVLLSLQVLIVSFVAASRYLFKYAPSWGESVALICMVWFCLLSATLAITDDSHLKVTLIDNFVSERTIKYMDLFDLVLIIILGIIMLFGGIVLVKLTSRNIMTGIGLPSGVLYAVIPVSGFAFVMAAIDRGRELLCHLKK
ncbi:MAG TPA: TRAP transporter small permease subunit [Candidatus Dorea intestinavium]|nr:TRAP transporter small permease subunit [Candidatus Dorea intestinavium]